MDIEEAISKLQRKGAHIEVLAKTPKLLIVISLDRNVQLKDFERDLFSFVADLDEVVEFNPFYGFRAVDIARLPIILASGIDVVPTDAPIYAESLTKALEYGGCCKILMLLSPSKMDSTYRKVSDEVNPEEVEELKKTFPTVLRSVDGTYLWLSRLPEADRRVGSGYESHYARWIPGDPFECLQAVIVLGVEGEDVMSFTRLAIESCSAIRWR